MKPCSLFFLKRHGRIELMKKAMKLSILVLVLFFLHSCGVRKLIVDNAAGLLSYQVTRHIPLYGKQKDDLGKDIEKFLNQSKPIANEILPVIDRIELNNHSEVETLYKKIEVFYNRLSNDFSALMAKYMALLDSKQQKDLFEGFDDENREILKIEKEKRLDDIEDRFKKLLGSITGPQKQLIRDHEDYFLNRAKDRLKRRIKLHEKLRWVYKQDISLESRTNEISDAFRSYQSNRINGSKNLDILKSLLPTLTKNQKEHFRKHVEDIKELLKYFLSIDY